MRVSIARSTNESFIITLLVQNGGQNNFLVNNVSGVITTAQFAVVPATGGQWYAARVTLPIATYPNGSVITITNSSNIFQLGVMQGGTLGASVGYFSDYNTLEAHASSSTPILCAGISIQLAGEFIASATYNWTGPNGFTSNMQNPVINNATILNSGTYHLTVTVPGCGSYTDAVVVTVNTGANSFNFDFTYQQSLCNPLSVQFTGIGVDNQNPFWSFGDATTVSGITNPVHIYPSAGNYIVKYSVGNGACTDTITKTITLSIINDDIILTRDTIICSGTY